MASATHRTIRFRISLLLLLSALNTIVMVALAVIAMAGASEGPDLSVVARIARVSETFSFIHEDALAEPEQDEVQVPIEALDTRLQGLGHELAQFGGAGAETERALATYQSALRIWDGDGRPRAGSTHEAVLNAHRVLLGALYVMVPNSQRSMVDTALPYVPWVLVWVVTVALLTVMMSFQLRNILSRPLARLATAAVRVSQGELDAAIPEIEGVEEFRQLSASIESMRTNLVRSIGRLDEQNSEMHTMLGALSDGVIFLDERARIMEYNTQAERLLEGFASAGALLAEGVQLREAFPDLPERLFYEAMESTVQLPVTFSSADKRQRHLSVRLHRVTQESHGFRKVLVAVIRDITEALEVEQVKRDFMSVITHELKTPLTAIDGFVRLLLMEKAGPLNPKQRRALETVRDQGGALREMVQDLLDSTRLEGGNMPMEPSAVDVRQLVNGSGHSFRPSIESKGLSLDIALDVPTGTRVFGDQLRLQQILGNFIRNAIKFTPSGGQLRLSTHLDEDWVVMEVTDTGRGIPQDAVPRLFGKFFQVERGDTRIAGGTGLGLYICSQLATAMNGTVGVRSEVDVGSTFFVRFPQHRHPPTAHEGTERST